MAEGFHDQEHPPSTARLALETGGATIVALFVSLRLGAPVVWLLVPLVLVAVLRKSPADFGLEIRFRPPSWTTHLVLGAALLLLYAALHAGFANAVLGQTFTPGRLPGARILGWELIVELLAIGIPEEAFFRGYLQSRWNERFGRPWTVFGARVGPGLLLQSAIFALCHLAIGDWTRLRVFFFALLAGWLRERSDSVAGSAVYHAVANVWYRLVASAFR